jgi:hypothetical protein
LNLIKLIPASEHNKLRNVENYIPAGPISVRALLEKNKWRKKVFLSFFSNIEPAEGLLRERKSERERKKRKKLESSASGDYFIWGAQKLSGSRLIHTRLRNTQPPPQPSTQREGENSFCIVSKAEMKGQNANSKRPLLDKAPVPCQKEPGGLRIMHLALFIAASIVLSPL